MKCDNDKKILEILEKYGSISGQHHKMWVIDQIARIVTGEHYGEWVLAHDKENPTFPWGKGIAP